MFCIVQYYTVQFRPPAPLRGVYGNVSLSRLGVVYLAIPYHVAKDYRGERMPRLSVNWPERDST